MKLGINGFGRIGRMAFRSAIEHGIDVAVVNDPFMDDSQIEYLLKYDTVHGRIENVKVKCNQIHIDGKVVLVTNSMNPKDCSWGKYNVDIVLECSGVFTKYESASAHVVNGGAKCVIISAPSSDDNIPTFVMGVNHKNYNKDMTVVSNASCTTNCLAPIAKLVNDNFGLEEGLMTTIHAATINQSTVDGVAKGGKDYAASRSVFNNIIPATTGAAKAVGKVIPELKGKLTGMAFRVPTSDVSVVDLTCRTTKPFDMEEFLSLVKLASNGEMSKIIGITEDPTVSSDFLHDARSSIFAPHSSMKLNDHFVKLISWYDNEWGYSNRLIDLAKHIYSCH